MSYAEKLKDPRWQKKRLEILERDWWMCCECGDNESTLHVHHTTYKKGKDPWDYPNHQLITLCEECHESEKNNMENVLSDVCYILKDMGYTSANVDELKDLFADFRFKEFFSVPPNYKASRDELEGLYKKYNIEKTESK